MSSRHPRRISHSGGLPIKLILGILFSISGLLLFIQLIGKSIGFNVPSIILEYICAVGSVLGGLYMLWRTIWRPRIYV
ncbi:hypothetical protein JXB41_06180 [Candidatus Woesearchaeota archaeon]|nr:hypothetical protein [Candidatus Woesearchaeota archaeon]